MAGSGLSFFLFCGGEEDVVQNQAIPRAVGVEIQVCRRITNTVSIIFRIVAAIEGKRPLAVISVEIFYLDRKSTRLNSSHVAISYAVFCLKKKNKKSNHFADRIHYVTSSIA